MAPRLGPARSGLAGIGRDNAKMNFEIHPRLLQDTFDVCQIEDVHVRLLNDARYLWLVLIPETSAIELHHLDSVAQARLLQVTNRCAAALEVLQQPDKLNIGALGNLVPQLHVHVIARNEDDPAWPGPVWGHSEPVAYPADQAQERISNILDLLD